MKKTILVLSVMVFTLIVMTGCTAPWTTNTGRNAIEQQLLAVAIERGVDCAAFAKYAGKKFFIDYSNCAPQVDKPYLQSSLEYALAKQKIVVAKAEKDADFILEPGCGVLATNYDKIFIGLPTIPAPIPSTSISFVIPEIPFFSKYTRFGNARMRFNLLKAKDRIPEYQVAPVNIKTYYTNWSIFFIPFSTTNMDIEPKATPAKK